QIKNEFDLELVNICWRGERPKKLENVLVRAIAPNEIIASSLWRRFRVIDLFAGIGGIRLGFESVGGQCVFSSEWDESAQQTYQVNFGEKPFGDITQIETSSIPDHDILLAGFPCQPFSIIGKQQGFADTRGTLFFEIERILKDKQPTAFLLENVKQFKTHDNGRTCQIILEKLHKLGYHTYITVLNALDFGVAQKRERTIIVGFLEPLIFRFPESYPYQPLLQDVLEHDDEVDKKLFASEMICKKRLERLKEQGQTPFYPSMWHENKGGHIGIHPFSCALRHNASYNYLLVNGNRRPSGREMLRFQGFPETFKISVDHSAIRAQAGNSVAVPVITAVVAEMMIALRNKKIQDTPTVAVKQRTLFETKNYGIEETVGHSY
ncbi:MAG: DNA (cytosine-5-)-methyltransferase, partial [Planctomycetaceae bacterium]|nr:DNA (cytosine-5-)-methyltransferase [Planctomycetaceae bacterium]